MSFVFTFTPTGDIMTAAQYDAVTKRLEQTGYANPKGRLYHLSYGTPDSLIVTDVWDSVENFEKFGAVLMPILQEFGINPGQPAVYPVHNVIEAAALV